MYVGGGAIDGKSLYLPLNFVANLKLLLKKSHKKRGGGQKLPLSSNRL